MRASVLSSRRAVLLGLPLLFAAGSASAQAGGTPRPLAMDRASTLILVRGPLAALDQANKTGNYTVLRDLGGPTFQQNTAARLAELFAHLRQDEVDLSAVLALEPLIMNGPLIDAGGRLQIAGVFPSYPRQLNFAVAYESAGGLWRLFGLSISAAEPTPTAGAPRPPGG